MSTEIRWEEPPPARGRDKTRRAHNPLRDSLIAHPGKWALVLEWPPNSRPGSATSRRYQYERSSPWAEFELRSGMREDGSQTLHARYIGAKA